MHPVITAVRATLDQSRNQLQQAIDAVPAALRDQPPGSNRWSVALVLEHLALVADRSAGIITRKIDEARAAPAVAEEAHPALLPAALEATLVDRSAKRDAPDAVRPAGLGYDAALARFDAARARLDAALAATDGLAVARFVHEHPRFGALNPYQWAGFVAAHESRHAQQIAEIAAELQP